MDTNKKVISKLKNARLIRTTALTFVCFVLGILIAMQYKNIRAIKAKEELSYNTVYEYQKQLIKMQEEMDTLTKEKAELQKKVEVFEKGIPTQQIELLQNELKNVKTFAGLSKVKGPGIEIVITLTNPEDLPRFQPHLLMLLNELNASSAQAISINGARIVSMSEVRVVGSTLAIDGQVYGQPITISAIGNSISMYTSFTMNGGIKKTIMESFRNEITILETVKENIVMDAYDITKIPQKIDKLTPITD